MAMKQTLRPKKIRELLGTSFAEFDRRNGWPIGTTKKAVQRWSLRAHGFPGGQQAVVLIKLSREIERAASPALDIININ
jgi:hypothetical protein